MEHHCKEHIAKLCVYSVLQPPGLILFTMQICSFWAISNTWSELIYSLYGDNMSSPISHCLKCQKQFDTWI